MTKAEFLKKRAEELGLELVPYEALLNTALIELGKCKSYIDELEYTSALQKAEIHKYEALTAFKNQIKAENKETRKEIYREQYYQGLLDKMSKLKEHCKSLIAVKDELIYEKSLLNQKIIDLKAQIEVFEKQVSQ